MAQQDQISMPLSPGRLPKDAITQEIESQIAKKGAIEGANIMQGYAPHNKWFDQVYGGKNMPPPGELPNLQAIFGRSGQPAVMQANTVGQGVPSSSSSLNGPEMEGMNRWMEQAFRPIDPELYKQATTLVPTGAQIPQMPSLSRPVEAYQNIPFNRQPVVGAGNARARGIENAFTGVANAVGKITTQIKQQNQDKLAVATQKLMTAQSAIDQANMAMKTASPEQQTILKDSIKGNTELINTMLSDKKLQKQLSKGMQISFTDPSENKTDEHGGVQKGVQSFQQQFASQMPRGVAYDPVAQSRLQMEMQQQKAQLDAIKAVSPYLSSVVAARSRLGVANTQIAARAAIANQNWANRFAMQDMKFAQASNLLNQKYAGESSLLNQKYKDYAKAMKDIYQYKIDNPSDLEKAFLKASDTGARLQTEEADYQRKLINDAYNNTVEIIPVPDSNAPDSVKQAFAKLPMKQKSYSILYAESRQRAQDLATSQDRISKSMIASGLGGGEDATKFADSIDSDNTGGQIDYNDINSFLNAPTDNESPRADTGTGAGGVPTD